MHKKILFFCSEGLLYIVALFIICIITTAFTFLYSNPILIGFNILLWLLFLEFCYFFRDPDRNIPQEPGAIIAPADGKIISINKMKETEFLKSESIKVSIFMNVFNVHVNRAPISGRIEYYHYNPGKFISAFKDKASLDNEQVSIGIHCEEDGKKVLLKLIAGLIARRIVLWKRVGDELRKGERISIIKFGSRVELYLPLNVELKVNKGDWVRAGETIIGMIIK
ncbi:MAG: phosphatidylserine decarboxylase family protein [Deltaproteobacteria bacterium]|nr:MAG: phosphatidylserine decarboxylase family protein [Deltaproteobacteria bacterium]